MQRGFKVIKGYEDKNINLPVRSTKLAAGYDFEAAEDTLVPAFTFGVKPTLIPTAIKAYMADDEYLMIVNRSSGPKKKGLVMPNAMGIIDADYYENPDNDGNILFQFINISGEDVLIKKGERIGQGIFMKYLKADDDVESKNSRNGGFGSTGN